ARRPPGLIGRYRPIQGSIIALDITRSLLIPLLASNTFFLSYRLKSLSMDALLQAAVMSTITSESSVMIMGFVYRFFTLKGTRLNGLLSIKWILVIILISLVQCTA
ncbi:hypothetical protein PENTCL1PPCAC_5950, partial [Pristionchus entomophagus]